MPSICYPQILFFSLFFLKDGEYGGKWVLKSRQAICCKLFHVVLNYNHSILWCFQIQPFSTFQNICGCVHIHKDQRHFAPIWNLQPMCFLRRYGFTNLALERAHPSGQIVVSIGAKHRCFKKKKKSRFVKRILEPLGQGPIIDVNLK